ncbi:MAG: hypothetical protein IPP51_05675 [Bacteroidetes bacterium]|nr:hypothetical protein [Bacteroidota bacterium]
MKRCVILFTLLFSLHFAKAQTIVLQKENTTRGKENFGPNLKNYTQFYFTIGMLASPDFAGARVKHGGSLELGFGLRQKYKVGSVYSWGWLIAYEYQDYELKQEDGKLLPSAQTFDEQRIDISYGYLGLFNRFNFDPSRGNTLGKFFEFGVRGKYALSASEIQKYKVATGNAQTEISGLKYFRDWQADVYAQLGRGHFSIWGAWRLTELLHSSYNYPKLPYLTVGIELGF